MAYPLPSAVDMSGGFLNFIRYLNSVTSFAFIHFSLLALATIIIISYWRATREVSGALILAGVITSIIVVPLRIMHLIPTLSAGIIIGFTFLGLVYLFASTRN